MTDPGPNPYDSLLEKLEINGQTYKFYNLKKLNDPRYERLPISIRVLLEAAIRNCDNFSIKPTDVEKILDWKKSQYATDNDIPFKPARVLLQDLTGVAVVVDFAGMRDAYAQLGGKAEKINPLCQVDLVVDHSVQVDFAKTAESLQKNQNYEFERNKERFRLFKWAAKSMDNFRIIPPGSGICHQINLEYLAHVVYKNKENLLYPDSLVGADSHTVMINGLGVVGYGCGGIECEAVMLGQILSMPVPQVVGYKLTGQLDPYATSTDLVLTITKHLRSVGVVGKFLEFFGPGLAQLSLADRATIANMCPEYGATVAFFPVDDKAVSYLKQTGRQSQHVEYVQKYLRSTSMFRENFNDPAEDPEFSQVLELDLSTVRPSVSGPKRPHDRVPFAEFKKDFLECLRAPAGFKGFGLNEEQASRAPVKFNFEGQSYTLEHGSVVIAAITSCTNTSNPSVMLGAGLLAKKAVEKGLSVRPYIKTSLSPGSGVVTYYLKNSGVLPYLEKLGFYVVGYGCQTCIGNSGPLEGEVMEAIKEGDLVVAGVLSGNRNFEGRVHPLTRANYLASPLLVVACAIAGKIIDFENEPLGTSADGSPVFLRDIWPTKEEIDGVEQSHVIESLFREVYENIEKGSEDWAKLDAPESLFYPWDPASNYLKKPFFYDHVSRELDLSNLSKITNARALLFLGDSISTDMISPAGAMSRTSPAYRYLTERGVQPKEINSYGAYRGNDAVMIRGTFANIRLSNRLLGSVQKPRTLYLPTGEELDVYDAAVKYKENGTPLVIVAGKEYGCGSSRDWAAKGAVGLGVRAVIAESYERIHRSNLIGMSVLPLQFMPGESADSLKLTGKETFTVDIGDKWSPRQKATVYVQGGAVDQFQVEVRFDTEVEIEYYKHGGILHYMIRQLLSSA
uniref:Cytoplasmic aconitate hydratase n=1 Tax=Aceria tosichella TaxID=561515 RepID=A0A6G1SJS5_9ACAR